MNYTGAGIGYYYWNNPNAAFNIMDNDYGFTTWIGITNPYSSAYTLLAADIRINYHYFNPNNNYGYSNTDYQRVVCHEAGHALGYFMHNDDIYSIMQGDLDDVIADEILSPTWFDNTCIFNMYYGHFN